MKAAEIDFAVMVDVVEVVFEISVDTEELIAFCEIPGVLEIVELHLVAGDGVAESREAEVSIVDDFIEEFFGELVAGNGFDGAGGLEAAGVEGGGDGRTEEVSDTLFGIVNGGGDETLKLGAAIG